MTTLKSAISHVSGLQYIVNLMDIKTSLGKHFLLNSPYLNSSSQIELELSNIASIVELIKNENTNETLQNLSNKLGQVMDIRGSIKRLNAQTTLDDVELFEIKKFSMLCDEISILLQKLNLSFIKLPHLELLIKILDPNDEKIPHFYIYSSYSNDLSEIRNLLKLETDEEKKEILRLKSLEIEDEIRELLCQRLKVYDKLLVNALHDIAYLDVVIAKANLAVNQSFVKPQVGHGETRYRNLFNPFVQDILKSQNRHFQPININFNQQPCLLTGVNMGGKTVLLKTIGLSQYLFQFGFYVPASSAIISSVEKIFISSGDNQSELTGLSSYAAEMMIINEIVKTAKTNTPILAIIDELARTTNPEEGQAIVNAILDILEENHVSSIVSTHYSGLKWNGRRLKIKGLTLTETTSIPDYLKINDLMNYSVVEDDASDNEKQALQIAKLLGVDSEILNRANTYLNE